MAQNADKDSLTLRSQGLENVEVKKGKLKLLKDYFFNVYFDTSFDYFKNGDLRDTDTTSMTTVQFSDDEMFLGYYNLGVQFKAVLYKDLQFYFDIYNSGYFGNDSPEFEAEGNTLFLKSAYFLAPFYKKNGIEFSAALGRQKYRISGLEKSSIESGPEGTSLGGSLYRFHRHFIMDDDIDGLVLNFTHRRIGFSIDALVDLFSLNSPGDSFYGMRGDRHNFTVQFFEGDVNVIRAALAPSYTLDNKGPLNRMKLKLFSSYSHIGAVGLGTNTSGGYEQSNAGASSNKPDGDWLLINSASLYMKFIDRLSIYFEFAHSYGKDFKNSVTPDVTINGFMLHPSIEFDIYDWLKIGAAGIYVKGSTTDKDGNYENYGFVSMKGDKIGGFLFSDYYGNYPYAVVDYYGLWYDGYKTIRRAPMASANFALAIENLNVKTGKKGIEGLNLIVEGWVYFDTSTTGADFSNSSLPAYVLSDQKRLPEEGSNDVAFMGFEADLMVSYTFFKGLLEVGTKCGVFVPWTYFDVTVSDQTAPAGTDVFWGIEIFSKIRF